VSPGGELNFKMLADLHGGMVGGVTKIAGMGTGKSGIPFAIAGTTSNPKFTPDVTGMVGGALQGVLSGKTPVKGVDMNALGGLFGKKKPPK
jgi:AsmA protein